MSTWQAHWDSEGVKVGMLFQSKRWWQRRTRTVEVIDIYRLPGHIYMAKGYLVATVRDTITGRERDIYCDTLANPRKWTLATIPKPINLDDLVMYQLMYMASPDGQAERDRQRKLLEQFSDASIEFNGYFTNGRDDRG